MRLQRRVERIENGALPSQDRHRRHHGSECGDPESDPPEPPAGGSAEAFLGKYVPEPHDEEGREDERHEDAVRRHRHVVERLAPLRKVDVRHRQPLKHAHGRREAEGRDGDADVRERKRMAVGHRVGPHLTMSLPTMAWCIRPQYSLQAIGYSPGRAKVTVNWLT